MTFFSIYFIFIGWQIRTNMTTELRRNIFGTASVGGTSWHMFAGSGEILFLNHHPGSAFICIAPTVCL
jgi:hypothetical protein